MKNHFHGKKTLVAQIIFTFMTNYTIKNFQKNTFKRKDQMKNKIGENK